MTIEYKKTFGMPELLTLLFIAGKIFGHLDWSWWVCFLPLIIVYGIGILIWLVILIINLCQKK